MCNDITKFKDKKEGEEATEMNNKSLQEIVEKGKFFPIPANSEDVAQLVHLALCVTL